MKPTDRRPPSIPDIVAPRIGKYRKARLFCALLLSPLLIGAGYLAWTYHGLAQETEIYQGITYSCQRLPEGSESGGLLHLIRADLNVPGVSLYVTPLDPDAVAHGWQYHLQYTAMAVREEHLAAAVNGTLFSSDSYWIRLPGDWARSLETVVADHVVSHVDPNTYLLWWDDALIAHCQHTKPPTPSVLAAAKWGIGSQFPNLGDGTINSWSGHHADHRTVIGMDSQRRLVWLACFDKASDWFTAKTMADLGAQNAICIDSGTSTAMAIGADAQGVRSGRVVGDFRPVATQFGFRALLLKTP